MSQPLPAFRLPSFRRSAEVERLSGVLVRAGERLDALDPPPLPLEDPGLRPVLRLVEPAPRAPRADG